MDKHYPAGDGAVQWISAEWLEDHLSDGNLRILDAQPDTLDYIQEHIPGAEYMNEGILYLANKGIPAQTAPVEAIQADLRRLGLEAGKPVAVYSGSGVNSRRGDGLEPYAVAYHLVRFGHGNVYILDGGLDRWNAERKPLAQEFPEVDESDFTCRIIPEYFIAYEEFRTIKDNENVLLLDVREKEIYEGQGPWIKPGHIPGAVNLPWKQLMDSTDSSILKPTDEIRAIFENIGASPDKVVICSCGDGRCAASAFLILRFLLGYPNVRIFEGSFTEWTAYPENPTVAGSQPYDEATAPGYRPALSGKTK